MQSTHTYTWPVAQAPGRAFWYSTRGFLKAGPDQDQIAQEASKCVPVKKEQSNLKCNLGAGHGVQMVAMGEDLGPGFGLERKNSSSLPATGWCSSHSSDALGIPAC
eukprot:1139900-Pelagomonas_calceolata.AAC.10